MISSQNKVKKQMLQEHYYYLDPPTDLQTVVKIKALIPYILNLSY